MEKLSNLQVYLDYFKGREDYFAEQGPDHYHPIKRSFDEGFLKQHLEGLATYGIYVLTSESKCNFTCFDLDISQKELEKIDFKNPAHKFNYLKGNLFNLITVFKTKFEIPETSILIEETGGRGYHVWLFFTQSLPGDIALKFNQLCKAFMDVDFEFFPKQPKLSEKRKLGNLIKLPLGVHQKYESKSHFFELKNEQINPIESLEANLSFLKEIEKLKPEVIERLIDQHKENIQDYATAAPRDESFQLEERILYKKDLQFLFDNCKALNNLKNTAEAGIPFTRQEAFHFTTIMLSLENCEEYIIEKIKRSYSTNYNEDITRREIERIKPLRPTSCGKLITQGICEGYCNKEIERKNTDPLLPKTNPVSCWLQRAVRETSIEQEEIINRIADRENIINAYWKLKKYHRDEDVGFFDEFDFDYFERDLEINTLYISRTLQKKQDIRFIGYLKVPLPKKVDEAYKMQYRQMVYPSVFDQVTIQAIFNVIAQILEKDFQDYSYGYRCDIHNVQSDNIFFDWREYYPKFRNRVLNHLRQPNIKYYICCDIKGFYDNIRHDILLEQLHRYIKEPYIWNLLETIIKMYEFEVGSALGVPQGPAYARILANLYLNDFDKNISKYSSGFFRYVDDFFIFFENEEEAEKGLIKIHEFLDEIGLGLSTEERKKPEILKASNEEKITSKLDSIQYGIFEEYKFIDHLDIEQVNNFYDAIDRYRISGTNIDDILDINNKLPSIIYLISNKSLFFHSIRKKIPAIVVFLIDHGWFYPKRLKYIFNKIIELLSDANIDIVDIFSKLHNTHKIYFILSLFEKCKKEDNYKELLYEIIKRSLKEEDGFIKGFAIAISNKLGGDFWSDIIKVIDWEETLKHYSYFPRMKFLSVINYFQLDGDKKEVIRKHLSDDNLYLEKKCLLSIDMKENNQKYLPFYIDNLFVERLLKTNTYFLIPECCSLLCSLTDNNQLFQKLINFISNQITYKEIEIYYLCDLVFEFYKNASTSEIENLVELYKSIEDPEIKRELINVLIRIQNSSLTSIDNFSKYHEQIEKYNQCYLYKNINEADTTYNYIEIIPVLKLFEYGYSVEKLKERIEDLSFKKIVPKLNFQFDSKKNEVSIKYKPEPRFKEFRELEFCADKKDILLALNLIENLYKKAVYFFRSFEKFPRISVDDLFVDVEKKELQFKNIGRIFCPLYIIEGQKIRNNKSTEIPLIMSLLLESIFFNFNSKKIESFHKASTVSGLELFLSHFMARMKSKKESSRYSHSRFHYLTNRINELDYHNDDKICVFYFQERLKSILNEQNYESVNWIKICNSLNDFYGELANIYDSINFKNIRYRNKTIFNVNLPRHLHYLSKWLLNLCLNKEEIIGSKIFESSEIYLFEIINYYTILCIEIISFFKISTRASVSDTDDLLLKEHRDGLRLATEAYTQDISAEDISLVNTLINKANLGHSVFDHTTNFDLTQFALFFLLRNFDHEMNNNHILIKNTGKLKKDLFANLTFNLLIRLPKIESELKSLICDLMQALKNNQHFDIDEEALKLRSDILKCCKEINEVRNKMNFKRFFGSVTKYDRLPVEICCRRKFRRRHYTTFSKSLDKIPLSNLFPSSISKCSWDMDGNKIHNLVIPNERINKLLARLKSGNIWGYRFDYLYSEKAKLLWDLGGIIILIMFFVTYGPLVKAISISGIIFFIGKILKKDIAYWSPKASKLIEYIRE